MDIFSIEFWGGAGIAALLMFVGHWFPWPKRLSLLARYLYGLVALHAGYAYWLFSVNSDAAVVVMTFGVGMGAVTAFYVEVAPLAFGWGYILVYILGVAAVLGMDSIVLRSDALGLWVMAAVACAATVAAWGYDALANKRILAMLRQKMQGPYSDLLDEKQEE